MIENLPLHISVIFILTVITTLVLFYSVLKNSSDEKIKSKAWLIKVGLILWLILQSVLSLNGFYIDTNSLPPKFIFAIAPPFVLIAFLFTTNSGRKFIDSLPLENITYTNVVRIPVELILYSLFVCNTIPQLMTFEGRNFDILAGVTAPFIAYFGFTKNNIEIKWVLVWNIISLGLLLNIVINAILSAPFSFQQFAFEQPNIAVFYFPFSLLPSFIVPVILFGHLVSIRQLSRKNN